jgi:hypothetical protein
LFAIWAAFNFLYGLSFSAEKVMYSNLKILLGYIHIGRFLVAIGRFGHKASGRTVGQRGPCQSCIRLSNVDVDCRQGDQIGRLFAHWVVVKQLDSVESTK